MAEEDNIPTYPPERMYRLDLRQCIVASCGGELAEVSYYERNNWATVEFVCNKCRNRFVVKAEM
jgi:hypothetical protein